MTDRAALVEAVLDRLDKSDHGYLVTRGHFDERDAAATLDAVLPLLADRIETSWAARRRLVPDPQGQGVEFAANLLRSLAGG